MIDLRGQQNIRHTWEISEEDQSVRVVFFNDSEEEFGDIIVNGVRCVDFFQKFFRLAKIVERDQDFAQVVGHITNWDDRDNTGNTEFREIVVSSAAQPPATIDLRALVNYQQAWSRSNGDVIVEFREPDGTPVESLIIEEGKLRDLAEVLREVFEALYFDQDQSNQFFSKANFDNRNGVASFNYLGQSFTPPAEAPPFVVGVAISGAAEPNETLTGNYLYGDVNGDLEGATTFKWYRSDDALGTNKTEIAGETSTTYAILPIDLNKFISFEVTPVALTGDPVGVPVESDLVEVTPLEEVPFVTNVNITGTPQEGEVLTGNYDYFDSNGDPEGSSQYVWYRLDDIFGTNKTQIFVPGAGPLPQQPNESFRSEFDSQNANISTGSNTGTISGSGGSISGGAFVTGSSGAALDFDKQDNYNLNVGTIRFKFAPNFNGFPPNGFNLLYHQTLLSPSLGNSIYIDWKNTGGVVVYISNNTNGVIVFDSFGGTVTGVSGVYQEWELNYDIPGNLVELYVDGIKVGNSLTGPFSGAQVDTAAAGIIRLGSGSTGSPIDGSFDDLQLFSTVQHTSDFSSEIPRALVPLVPADEVTYEARAEDVGKFLTFEVTPVALSGDTPGLPVESSTTPEIQSAVVVGPVANNQAIFFEGSPEFVRVPYNAAYSAVADISVFGWIRTDQAVATRLWINHFDFGPNQRKWAIGIENSEARFIVSATGGTSGFKDYQSSGLGLNDNRWHFIGFTFAANDLKCYVDGVEVTGPALNIVQDDTVNTMFNTSVDLSFGTCLNNGNGSSFNHVIGFLDEVSYHSKVLSPAEILEMYNNGLPLDLQTLPTTAAGDLVSWWRMNGTFPNIIDEQGLSDGAMENMLIENLVNTPVANFLAVNDSTTNVGASIVQDNNPNFFAAMGFIPDQSGNIGSMDLQMYKDSGITGDAVIEIQGDSGGNPDGVAIGTFTIPVAQIPNSVPNFLIRYQADAPIPVTSGTQYWFVWRPTGFTSAGGFQLRTRGNTSNPYPDGDGRFTTNAGSSWNSYGQDFPFVINEEI
jgi:hypothetical protein